MTGEPLLALRRIDKTYASAAGPVAALREVDLSVRAGECVAVTGPSGSGKSTFLSIVGCLDRPTGGAYRLAGCETTGLSARDLSELRRRFIGFVFQSYNLLPRLTALENVELPLVYARRPSGERRSRALEALDLVGLAAQGARRPAELSGGQQQRVSIARALVTAPGLVVADEPTSALDPETADQIVSLLTSFGGSGITLVMVTHDPGVAARCPRRLVFREGRIVADLAALPPDPPVSSATLANVSLVRHPALGA